MAYCGFKKGESGNPNGRPKGAKNKIRFDVAEIVKNRKCNPFEILADIAMGKLEGYDRVIGIQARREAASDLCQYIAPRLKAIELTGDQKENFTLFMNYGSKEQNGSGA